MSHLRGRSLLSFLLQIALICIEHDCDYVSADAMAMLKAITRAKPVEWRSACKLSSNAKLALEELCNVQKAKYKELLPCTEDNLKVRRIANLKVNLTQPCHI